MNKNIQKQIIRQQIMYTKYLALSNPQNLMDQITKPHQEKIQSM